MTDSPSPDTVIQIRKYANRRYYNITHSKHSSLEDIYRLVREGNIIRVTDSKNDADITPQILTQIILENEPPKITMFGSELLHHVIQANQSMLRSFIENYFSRALEAFTRSQSQFGDFIRQAGLSVVDPLGWTKPWTRSDHPTTESAPPAETPPPHEPAPDDAAHLRRQMEDLRRQIRDLQGQLASQPTRTARGKARRRR